MLSVVAKRPLERLEYVFNSPPPSSNNDGKFCELFFFFDPYLALKPFASQPDFVVLFLLVYYWFCSCLGFFFFNDVLNVLFLPPGQYKGLEYFLTIPPNEFQKCHSDLRSLFFKITLYMCFQH